MENEKIPKLFQGLHIMDIHRTPKEFRKLSFRDRNREALKVYSSDPEIIPEKWYPVTFHPKGLLLVCNLGFWFRTTAIKWWRYKIGSYNIRNQVTFIQGSDILKLKTSDYLYSPKAYFNQKVHILKSKMIFPEEIRISLTRKRYKGFIIKKAGSNGGAKEDEKIFFETMFMGLTPIVRNNYVQVSKSTIYNKFKKFKNDTTKKTRRRK